MKVGSLFSGIGGLELGLERAGMSVAWQVERDPYCLAVLRKHWPDVTRYTSIEGFLATIENPVDESYLDWLSVDLVCGGFPCQPVSQAGKKQAQADDRWLWPEFARVIRLLRPRYVLVENVPGLLARGMGDVLGDLAALGFDAEWDCLPAAAVGAPHRRDRVWIVAYPRGERLVRREKQDSSTRRQQGREGDRSRRDDALGLRDDVPDPARQLFHGTWTSGPGGRRQLADTGRWPTEPTVGRVVDGFPGRVDQLRALGNAVVPQLAEWIGRRLMSADEEDAR